MIEKIINQILKNGSNGKTFEIFHSIMVDESKKESIRLERLKKINKVLKRK